MRSATIAIAMLFSSAAYAGDFSGFYAGLGVSKERLDNLLHMPDQNVAVRGFAGHNWQTGNWVFGIEADARHEAGYREFEVPGLIMTRIRNRFNEVFAGSISARVGYAVGDMLIYGKAGIGRSKSKTGLEIINLEGSGLSDNCPCSSHFWDTFVSAGVGTEYNFGRLFARGEIEARHFYSWQEVTNLNGGISIGVRF